MKHIYGRAPAHDSTFDMLQTVAAIGGNLMAFLQFASEPWNTSLCFLALNML